MNQTRRILLLPSLRFPGTSSIHLPTTYSLYNQVTHLYPPISPQSHTSNFLHNTHKPLFFSSKPDPIIDLMLPINWSEKLEQQLSELNPKLTQETVIYILMRLKNEPNKASKFFNWVSYQPWFTPTSAIYNVLLKVYANKESIELFWDALSKMRGLGFVMDDETNSSINGEFWRQDMISDAKTLAFFYTRMVEENAVDGVVKEVVDVVMRSEWGYETERKLGQMDLGNSVSDSFVLRVLKELRGCPLKALRVFRWFGEFCGYEHSSLTNSAMARVLVGDDTMEDFWSMLKEMRSKGHEMDLDTYIKISRRFQKIKMLEAAVELYEYMVDGPYKPPVRECNVLLRSIAACRDPDLVLLFRVVKKYGASGSSFPKAVYDGVHRSFTRVGRFDEANEIVESMRGAGYEPDNITYSQLICGLCRARRLEEACKVLDVMEANGCTPDLKTWTILIQEHCAAKEVDKALSHLAKMMEKNCGPDALLLDVLVNGFLCQERVAAAYKLLVEMGSKSQLRPWQATYRTLIQKLLEDRKFEEALNLLHMMKKHNYPPSREPFVQYISMFGSAQDAREFLKALNMKRNETVQAYRPDQPFSS